MAYIQKENYLNWREDIFGIFSSEARYQKPDKYKRFVSPLLESKKHKDFVSEILESSFFFFGQHKLF